MTTTYTIRSIKHTETIDSTLDDAIARAREINEEYQPAFGVQIEDAASGEMQWDSEDDADDACVGYEPIVD